MSTVTLRELAASKACAHACAHPTRTVCGALIGPSSADASTSARDVVDCAPMFHGDVTTTPYFEIALEQIETWASREGRTIVGAYYANARDGDETPPACVAGTLDTLSARLRRAFGKENIDAFGMLIDATSLERVATAKDGETCAFRVVERDAEGEWTPSDRARATIETGRESAVRARVRRTLDDESTEPLDVCDFDDHFDDLSKDWRNPSFASSAA